MINVFIRTQPLDPVNVQNEAEHTSTVEVPGSCWSIRRLRTYDAQVSVRQPAGGRRSSAGSVTPCSAGNARISRCCEKNQKYPYSKYNHLNLFETRMHSSGMRTTRLLTVSQHALGRGVSAWGYLPRGVSAQGAGLARGCLPLVLGESGPGGVSASGPGGMCIPACNGADTPCGQTDTCENITFANFVCGR